MGCYAEVMRLYSTDNSELMEISLIRGAGTNLLVEGTIMGAIPIRAIVKPAELRRAMRLMSARTKWHAFLMLFRGSR
jgi:hypothetical protein